MHASNIDVGILLFAQNGQRLNIEPYPVSYNAGGLTGPWVVVELHDSETDPPIQAEHGRFSK